MSPTEKLLAELIALPSVNPAFLPPGDPRGGEKRVADFLAATAATGGLSVEFQQVFPGRSNLLARLQPRGAAKKRVILAPHMDTVGDATMPDSLFAPARKGGRIYGRGACDTKGSVAAMLTALLTVASCKDRPAHTEIVFAALIDEENGQEGSRALAGSGLKADLAIVGEPTRLGIITAHKGDLWLKLATKGRCAHGSKPHLGENAVHAMARIVHLLETVYAKRLAKRKHRILGPATVNVGAIRGGTQANIVPDYCQIVIDRRTIPGETHRGVCREIKDLLAEFGEKAELIDTKAKPCVPLETDPKLPLLKPFMDLVGQKAPLGADFFCDAAVLGSAGIPSVVFGPGDIAQAHTSDEWIAVKSLNDGTDLLVRFLRGLP